jgi:hypothetical protein
MQIPLIAQQGRGYSLPLNAIKTVNFYPVADPSGKQKTALYGCPGSNQWVLLFGADVLTASSVLSKLGDWWPLTESSGTRFDLHGTNHLNVVGAQPPTVSTGNPASGSAILISGTDSYIERAGASCVGLDDATQYEIVSWVKPNLISGSLLTIISKTQSSTSMTRGYSLHMGDNGGSDIYGFTHRRARSVTAPTKGATSAVWQMVSMVRSGTNRSVAINAGAETVTETGATTVNDPSDTFRFGWRTSFDTTGTYIGQTAFFKNVLTTAERLYLFNSGAGVDYAKLQLDASGAGTTPIVGKIRGCLELNDVGYVVAGNAFIVIDSLGNYRQKGSIDIGAKPVNVETNGNQVVVCDGSSLWIFDITTEVFAQITDPDFPGAGSFAVLDGYGLFNKPGTGQFYTTALLDFKSVDALDFATAESSPDDLIRVFSNGGTAWMFGKRTIEPWQNSGDQLFPFSRVGNVRIQRGLAGVNAVTECDGVPMFLGDNRIFYRLDGYSVNPISNEGVEFNVSRMSVVDDCIAMSYTQEGHLFCVFKFPTEKVSWVFDVGTGLWHERVTGDNSWRANCMMKLGNRQLIGDDSTPRLLEIRTDIYADDGQELVSTHVLPTIWEDNNKIRHASLEVDMESGIGSLLGSDPSMVLDWSEDGGRTYGNFLTRQFGKVGQYLYRAIWTRLGSSQERIYRLRISDPVKRVITGVSLNGTDKGR